MSRIEGDIGSRIRDVRKLGGWSQVDLARRAGVGLATVHRIEDGHFDPRISTLRKLADALYVRIEWVLGGEEPMASRDQMTPDAQHDAHTGPGSEGLPGYVVIDPGGPWRHPDVDDEAWEIDPSWTAENEQETT